MRVLLLDLRGNRGGLRDEAVEIADLFLDPLQDHDRALIVGDTTFGKGIVQTVFTLAPDLALRMTTARWYTPGRSIQGLALDSAMGAVREREPLPTFSTGDRRLHASNGLVPDAMLGADTLTTAESVFAQSLGNRSRRSATY